jgi:very-short-patch-repair endonuclease
MRYQRLQRSGRSDFWALTEVQHGVIARRQLMELGLHPQAIKRRIRAGVLHPIMRGIYAVGRPQLTRHGYWMAAVLSCGPSAVLSHESAAALWGIRPPLEGQMEISLPAVMLRCRPGIVVHRRITLGPGDVTERQGIPVTTVICTLVDIAARLGRAELERAVGEADRLDLTDPEQLRSALDGMTPRPGLAAIRETLDRRTFALTDSELERRFLRLVARAGLPVPETRRVVNGFRVDFYWRELGLVVETDGLRYHRTPAQQTKDRIRDQAHLAAGMTPLRFTHAQVRFESRYVRDTIRRVAGRIAR